MLVSSDLEGEGQGGGSRGPEALATLRWIVDGVEEGVDEGGRLFLSSISISSLQSSDAGGLFTSSSGRSVPFWMY